LSLEGGVDLGGQERQEFSFTLYDFDGHGKITKDVSRLEIKFVCSDGNWNRHLHSELKNIHLLLFYMPSALFLRLLYCKLLTFLEGEILVPVKQFGLITIVKVTLQISSFLMLVPTDLSIMLFINCHFDSVGSLLICPHKIRIKVVLKKHNSDESLHRTVPLS
jgi:hypothetical protein